MSRPQLSIQTVEAFLTKVGAANSEPGSIGGETEHPVKNVDDRTEAATEGSRSTENSKDVKDAVGAPSVENKSASILQTAARFAKRAESDLTTNQVQIGTNKQPVLEDPSNGVSSAKGGKDDPGSDSPARTDNDALDGHKYAYDANTPLETLMTMFKEAADNFCVAVSTQPAPQAPARAEKVAQTTNVHLAHQAGWELAGLVNGTFDEKAASAVVQSGLAEIIKTAMEDADNVARCMHGFLKGAEEGMPEEGGEPPAPGGEGGGGEDMMAAMGGGAPADPMGGGMPPEAGGGAPPGGAPDAEAAQLAQILAALNVSPEELQAAMASVEGGGGGGPGMGGDPAMGGGMPPPDAGMPPGGAGMPPGGAGMPPGGDPMGGAPAGLPGMEAQASVKAGGKLASDTDKIASYIKEIMARSKK